MSTRKTISTFDKEKILKKQKGRCAGYPKGYSCMEEVGLYNNFDHIIALGLGGKNTLTNIQALCHRCHGVKTREDRHKIRELMAKELTVKEKKTILQKMSLPLLKKLARKYDVNLKDKVKKASINDGVLAFMTSSNRKSPKKTEYIKALLSKKILRRDVEEA